MNYSIKINQVAIAHLFPTMDIKDAAILDWMSQFATSPNISILVLDGIVYRWYSYKKIINDMPLLKIKSKRSIYDRIKKMVDLGILLAHPHNQTIGKTYYGFSELYQEIVTFKPMSKNSKGVGVKTPRGYEEKLQGGMRENSDNTNTIDPPTIDPPTIDPKIKANQEDLQDVPSLDLDKKRKEKKEAKEAQISEAVEIMKYLNLLAGRGFQVDPKGRGEKNIGYVVELLKKGFTKDEIKGMIEYKCYEWKHDVKMKHLLQPITIFKRHGERYIELAIEAMGNESLQRDIQARVKAEKKSSGVLEVDEKTKETLERMKKYKH